MNTALIFDADGVVIRSEPFTDALEKQFGIPASTFVTFFKERFPDCLVGKADLRKELSSYLPGTPWQGTLDEFIGFWFEAENRADLDLLTELRQLRKDGFLLALGTNQERLRLQFMKSQMGFDEVFDRFYASCVVGDRKPSAAYFESVARDLASEGVNRIVFFDDREENVAAAQAAGWEAYVYQSIEDVRAWRGTRGNVGLRS